MKSYFILLLCTFMLVSMVYPLSTYAKTNNSGVATISQKDANMIEQKASKIADLRLDIAKLSQDKADHSKEIKEIEKQINEIQKAMMNLGADKPSKELMVKLIKASDKEQKKTLNQMAASNGVSTNSSDWHPEDLIEQFDEMYDVWGYSTTYNGRLQYHLIFQHEGNDPYLAKLTTKHVYNDFSAGSSTAEKWVDEILKVYAEKSTGAYLGLLNPVLNWLPWELLFDSKPSANDISSSTSATVFTLATNTTVKFVYIYDTNNEDWWFALSTNYVYWSWEVSEYVFKNGHSYQDEDSGSNIALYGDYYSASSDADEAFTNGHSRKTTIYKQALWSESFDRDEIVHNIHSPTFVAHMM